MTENEKSKNKIPLTPELKEKLKKERHPRKVEAGFAMEAYTLWVTLKDGAEAFDLAKAAEGFQASSERAYPDPKPETCRLTGEIKELDDFAKASLRRYKVDCADESMKPEIGKALRALDFVEKVDLQPIIGLPRSMFDQARIKEE